MQWQKKDKGTNNDLQNITQKTKDWTTRTSQENIDNTLKYNQSLRTCYRKTTTILKETDRIKKKCSNTFCTAPSLHRSQITPSLSYHRTLTHQRNKHTIKLSISTYRYWYNRRNKGSVLCKSRSSKRVLEDAIKLGN